MTIQERITELEEKVEYLLNQIGGYEAPRRGLYTTMPYDGKNSILDGPNDKEGFFTDPGAINTKIKYTENKSFPKKKK